MIRPHIKRHFIGKRLGWGWGVFQDMVSANPHYSTTSFQAACFMAKQLYEGGRFVQV